MCAQYVMYAKNVDDDGVESGLLGFGFDKAALLPPPPSGFSSPHARRTQPHSNRAGATPPPYRPHPVPLPIRLRPARRSTSLRPQR